MMSKISYRKLMKEDLRHHITPMIINGVVFFIYILCFILGMQNTLNQAKGMVLPREEIIGEVAAICEPALFIGVIMALLGLYAAIEGFHFLHSKKKMDFYGALPITREKQFAVLVTNQILMYVIPLVINTALCAIVVAMTGYGTMDAYVKLLYGAALYLGSFMVAWAIGIFAMIVTGNTFVALFGIVAIVLYVPFVFFALFPGYCHTFLTTYVEHELNDIWYCFSPATIMSRLFLNWEETEWTMRSHGVWLIPLFVWVVTLLALSYVLYRKRRTETAGKAIAFDKYNSVLRFVIVIPVALIVGLVFWLMSAVAGPIWAFLGLVIGSVLSHMALEAIFALDMKKIFKHKLWLVGEVVVALVIAAIFMFDLTGYNNYIPEATEVKAVVVNWRDEVWNYSLEEIEMAKEMPEAVIKDALDFAKVIMESDLEIPEDEVEWTEDRYSSSSISVGQQIEVNYVLKNGAVKRRVYSCGEKIDATIVDEFFSKNEYKQSMDGVIDYWFDEAKGIMLYDIIADGRECRFTREEYKRLAEAYKKDYENLTYAEMRNGDAVYGIEVYTDAEMLDYEKSRYFPIYLSYTNTLKALEELGEKMHGIEDVVVTYLEIAAYTTMDATEPVDPVEFLETETITMDKIEECQRVYIDDVDVIEKYRDKLSMSYKAFYRYPEESLYNIYANVKDAKSEERTDEGGVNLYASPEICRELMKLGTPIE